MESKWDDTAEQQALGAPPRGSGRLIGLFLLLGVVMALVLIVRSLTPRRDPAAVPAVGQAWRDLKLEPLTNDAEPLTLDGVQGKVTLINCWGTWCGPCIVEFPELMDLRSDLATKPDFQFVSVSYPHSIDDEGQLKARTNAFLKTKGYALPVHYDPHFTAATTLMELNRERGASFPTTVLLDRKGVIRGLWIGYRPGVAKEMREQIDLLLK